MPHLTRSALHRCLQRHSISRLPDIEGDKALLSKVEGPKRHRFKRYPIGFFHMDIGEVQTAEGKALLSLSKALSVRRHRPYEQVRGHPAGRQG
jgi:hypothetical protein